MAGNWLSNPRIVRGLQSANLHVGVCSTRRLLLQTLVATLLTITFSAAVVVKQFASVTAYNEPSQRNWRRRTSLNPYLNPWAGSVFQAA
eukprot:5310751-Amphidinium_carterae.1